MDSQKPTKIRRVAEKPYAIWTNPERMELIKMRIKNNHDFTSKNANITAGWRKLVAECDDKLGRDKTPLNCKQQWSGLLRKYKSFFKVNTGDGAGDDAPDEQQNKEDWPYFELIHSYASNKDNYHPPYLIDSSIGVITNLSNPTTTASQHNEIAESTPDSPMSSTSSASVSRLSSAFLSQNQYLAIREKRDKKITKKISGLLAVFAQMVKEEYPNINVDSLLISSGSDSD